MFHRILRSIGNAVSHHAALVQCRAPQPEQIFVRRGGPVGVTGQLRMERHPQRKTPYSQQSKKRILEVGNDFLSECFKLFHVVECGVEQD